MPDEVPPKHITEALGGRYVAPPSDAERVERERVRNLIQAVLSCYHGLVSQETDEIRLRELRTQEAFYTEQFRWHVSLSADERQEVLRTYPDLLASLRDRLG